MLNENQGDIPLAPEEPTDNDKFPRYPVVNRVDSIEEYAIRGCKVCGCSLVTIRGKFPNTPQRKVCPTCLQDKIDQIHEISSSTYGVTYSNPQA
jgi:hypothetical protein